MKETKIPKIFAFPRDYCTGFASFMCLCGFNHHLEGLCKWWMNVWRMIHDGLLNLFWDGFNKGGGGIHPKPYGRQPNVTCCPPKDRHWIFFWCIDFWSLFVAAVWHGWCVVEDLVWSCDQNPLIHFDDKLVNQYVDGISPYSIFILENVRWQWSFKAFFWEVMIRLLVGDGYQPYLGWVMTSCKFKSCR